MAASKAKKSPKAAAGPSSPGRTATLPTTPLSTGPRFDKYEKLMHRFFEPLILLHTLGKTRGVHSRTSVEKGSMDFTRKTFLDDLSYICDFEKGGQTTAAVAIADDRDRYVFWFALNKRYPKIQTFLESTLSIISESIRAANARDQEMTRDDFVAKLTRHCFEHAKIRIKQEVRLLRRYIEGCTSFLAQEPDSGLANWLNQFRQGDPSKVCSLAFEHRRSEKMVDIKNRGRQSRFSSGAVLEKKFDNNPFAAVHHLIGRIAHHVRAPKRLVESAQCFEQVLDSSYVVCQAPILEAVPPPKPDGMTNLPSILNRMAVKDEETNEALMELDRMLEIQKRMLEEYQNHNFKPTVHAEIHIHQHFNAPGRQKKFALELPVIGCSKPACYCCKLYIKYHPARCVEPESHENVWLNWSPPALPSGHLDAGFEGQRDVLQKIIEEIRRSAVEQIQARRGPGTSHPDSTTGITKLTRANLARTRGVGPGLAALSIQESPAEYQRWDGGSEYGEDGDTIHNPSRPGSSAGSELSETPSRSSLDFSPSPASRSPNAEVDESVNESDSDSDDDDGGGVLLFKPRQQNWPRI